MENVAQEVTPVTSPMLVGIPEEALRRCTVPIAAETLREFFVNKNIFYVANHTNSKLKGTPFLDYLTNLDVPCDVDFDYPLPYEEFEQIMLAYFTQKSITNVASLHVIGAMILLAAKGLEFMCIPYVFPVEEKFFYDFIAAHKELIDRQLHFLDSTQVYALTSIPVLNRHYKPKERFENIDDRSYVALNVVMMYRMPEFTGLYFAIGGPEPRMSYFVQQFEEYMFKSERLAKYFRNRNNLTSHMFEHLAQGTFKSGDVCDGVFKNGVFDPNSPHYEPIAFDHEAPMVEEGQDEAVQE